MKIIVCKYKTFLGILWFRHFCIYDEVKDKVYSWEWKASILWLNKWGYFEIHTIQSIKKECKVIEYIDCPYINMSEFCNIKKNGYNCIEIITYILIMNNKKVPKRMSQTYVNYTSRIIFLLLWIALWVIIWTYFWYWYTTNVLYEVVTQPIF